MTRVRKRFWIELGLAVLSGALFVLTLVAKDWVEIVLGVHPDRGDGSLEWETQLVAVVATVTFSTIARLEWVQSHEATR